MDSRFLPPSLYRTEGVHQNFKEHPQTTYLNSIPLGIRFQDSVSTELPASARRTHSEFPLSKCGLPSAARVMFKLSRAMSDSVRRPLTLLYTESLQAIVFQGFAPSFYAFSAKIASY